MTSNTPSTEPPAAISSLMHAPTLPQEAYSSTPHLPGSGINCSPETSRLLFDMDKLGIPASDRPVFAAVNRAVISHMSQRTYDLSHDYEHIQRVVSNALLILNSLPTQSPPSISACESGSKSPENQETEEQEDTTSFPIPYLNNTPVNRTIVFLACMVHDISDHKYINFIDDPLPNPYAIAVLLISCGATHSIASTVQLIADNHSYTRETSSEESRARVRSLVVQHPELAVVQDADRLDTLGVVGQGRCWAYDGAHLLRRNTSIQRAMQHHWEKLVFLPAIMKTEAGGRVAEERWKRMVVMRKWWDMETDVSSVI